ncbi:hypothetical protein MY10362_007468 [Beauveria mimosiformis]
MPSQTRPQRKVNPQTSHGGTKDENCAERWPYLWGYKAALGELVRLSHQLLGGSATLTGDESGNNFIPFHPTADDKLVYSTFAFFILLLSSPRDADDAPSSLLSSR